MNGPLLLRKYLDAHDLTGTAFALRASIHQTVVSNLLTGARSAGLVVAARISLATGGAVPMRAWLPPALRKAS